MQWRCQHAFSKFSLFFEYGPVRGGRCVSKSNTSCAERMTPGSASGLQCFAPMRLPVQSLFKACSDFKRQDHGETARSARRIGLGGSYGLLKAPTISVNGFPARPLPTWPNRSCFCRDALNRNRGRRNAYRDSPRLTNQRIEAFSDVRCRDSAARLRANTHECATKKDESH